MIIRNKSEIKNKIENKNNDEVNGYRNKVIVEIKDKRII
jgi:hypothetical protein